MLEIWSEFEEFAHSKSAAGQFETAEISEFKEAIENEEAISFTEGYFTELGRYVPGNVTEIDAEAAEFDEELQELSSELKSWIHQSETYSCAVASQTMIINQLEGGLHTESEFIEIAENNGWYFEYGTPTEDVGKIAETMGMDVEYRSGTEISDLSVANDPETKVITSVDSTLLKYPECGKRFQADHAVQVLRYESTPEGDWIIINDPDSETGRGAVYSAEVFEKACSKDIWTVKNPSGET